MKKWLLIGGLVVAAILGTIFVMFFNQTSKEIDSVVDLDKFIHKEYDPVFDKAYEHITRAGDELTVAGVFNWYYIEDGLDENQEIQTELKEIQEKLINKDVLGEDATAYKKNVLKQISILEESIVLLKDRSDTSEFLDVQLLDEMLAEKVDELGEVLKERNKLLEKYTE